MGGRAKPNWAVFVGGPLGGRRGLIPVGQSSGTHMEYAPSKTSGMRAGHEYAVTLEMRPGGFHEARSRVLSDMQGLLDVCWPSLLGGSTMATRVDDVAKYQRLLLLAILAQIILSGVFIYMNITAVAAGQARKPTASSRRTLGRSLIVVFCPERVTLSRAASGTA